MADQAKAIADGINAALQGFRAGGFHFWDVLPVQPNDWMYLLQRASAEGSRLDLHLVDGQGPDAGKDKSATVISVFDPADYSRDEGGFRIKTATRIQWGATEVAAKGKKGAALRITGG